METKVPKLEISKIFKASIKHLTGESSSTKGFKAQRGAPQQQNPGD